MIKKSLNVGYAGLTHLGINYTIASAVKGCDVTAYHYDDTYLSEITDYKVDFSEPNLLKYLKKNKKKINFTNNLKALSKCDIIYISHDVPIDKEGNSSHSLIKKLINQVIKIAKKNAEMVILCQVSPGFTEKIRWKKSNLYYQVETLVFGDSINRAVNPERIIIGCDNLKFFNKSKLNQYLKKYKCPIIPMSYRSAETSKIAINLFLVSSINTTNMIAEYCEKNNTSWSEIIPALRNDKRIGKFSYIKPGIGIGGVNLHRDLETFKEITNKSNTNNELIYCWQKNDSYQRKWIFLKINQVINEMKRYPKIGLLGLAYKENTDSIENSLSIEILKKYKSLKIKIYDPVVKIKSNNINHETSKKLSDAIEFVDLIIIMTPWPEFFKVNYLKYHKTHKNLYLIDPFNVANINLNLISNKTKVKSFILGEGKD